MCRNANHPIDQNCGKNGEAESETATIDSETPSRETFSVVAFSASSKKPAADRGRISKPQVRVINGNHSRRRRRRRRRKNWKWMGDISALFNRSADQIFDLLRPSLHSQTPAFR